jgi:two-component system nitrogen regulation response regulator GlnG
MSGQGHVLVVDDDRSLRLLCRVNLELDGFAVTEAASLTAARAALAEEAVDAVLLDVHVGSENGIDLLDELKRDRPELPVVLLTGESGLPAEARARADAVLSKPFEIRELTGTIERAVGLGFDG